MSGASYEPAAGCQPAPRASCLIRVHTCSFVAIHSYCRLKTDYVRASYDPAAGCQPAPRASCLIRVHTCSYVAIHSYCRLKTNYVRGELRTRSRLPTCPARLLSYSCSYVFIRGHSFLLPLENKLCPGRVTNPQQVANLPRAPLVLFVFIRVHSWPFILTAA